MQNSTIRYLLIGFGISLLLLLISTAASFVSITRLVSSTSLVTQSHLVHLELENIISNMKDAETGYRGYLLTKDSLFLNPYNGAYERAQESYNKAKELSKDDLEQQKSLKAFLPVMNQRFQIMERGLSNSTTTTFDRDLVMKGKALMDRSRAMVNQMQAQEHLRLLNNDERLQKYITITPYLIIGAALLSFFITIFAFLRITSDLKTKGELQQKVEVAAEEMKQRVALITESALTISQGDYSTRLETSHNDKLYGLEEALNKMASELERSFSALEKEGWLQQGVVELNDHLKGEKMPLEIAQISLNQTLLYLNGTIGRFYLMDETATFLSPAASYAVEADPHKPVLLGEGIVGQVAKNKAPLVLDQVPSTMFKVSSGLLEGTPATVILYPLVFHGIVHGLLEIGTIQKLPAMAMEYLQVASTNIAIALHTSQNRQRVQDLLMETQTQSEELLMQQDELQRTNADLEEQQQKLQASEEELRVQQEELLQSNQEMEEKAQLLEEQNQFIAQKSTELLQLNKEVEQKNRDLEISGKYKTEFLANMSHELRTPLNSILLLAKLLADSKELDLGDDRYEYAKVIHNSGQGLLELINEILDLSKIEAGQMEVRIEPVPFITIQQDMEALFKPLAQDKGLELVLDFDPTLPPFLSTDKQRLEQVLKNLLSNAIKFTDTGSVTLKVTPTSPGDVLHRHSLLQEVPVVAFQVTDTGIGIPQDKHALVFEAFKQADGSSRRSYGGTGLGLSISREISKLLGGEIHLQSEPGQGSSFCLYLPVALTEAFREEKEAPVPQQEKPVTAAAPASAPALKRVPPIGSVSPLVSPVPPHRRTSDDRESLLPDDQVILVIEDDEHFVKALAPFIKKKSYKILIASQGEEGLALARQYQPQGVLLDINLPIMDGWSVIEHLKQDTGTRHIPVHTMSSEEARRKSLAMGAVDFISKPMAEKELGVMLDRLKEASSKSSRLLLIIEQDEKHAQALATFFQENGIDTLVALSGEAGLRELRLGGVDGVVLDISANEEVAYQVLEQIKKDSSFEKLPVVVYTGSTLTQEDENRINRYAATSIVRKGDTYVKLLNEISIFLHLVDENRQERQPFQKPNKLIEQELAGKTILVADDDNRNLYSLTKILQLHHVNVLTAVNGKQVLDMLQEKPHLDAVLIDIMMPVMDGYETTSAIRKINQYKHLPIIAVTAKTMPQDRQQCIAAGASDYIAKPVDVDQLLSLLRVWLY